MMLCPTVALLGLGDPCLTVAGIDTDAPLARPILCASALNELILDMLNKDLRPRGFFTELVGETGVSIAGESEAVVAGDSTKGEPKGDTEASPKLVGANLTGAGKHMCSGMGNGSKELITPAHWSAHSQAQWMQHSQVFHSSDLHPDVCMLEHADVVRTVAGHEHDVVDGLERGEDRLPLSW
jgi:hypothetical protein